MLLERVHTGDRAAAGAADLVLELLRVLAGLQHHLRAAGEHLRRVADGFCARQAAFDAAVGQRLDEHIRKRGAAAGDGAAGVNQRLGNGVDDARGRHERAKRREIAVRDIAVGTIEHDALPHGAGRVRQDADDLLIRAEQPLEPLQLHTGEHGHKNALRRRDGRCQRLHNAVDHLRLDAEKHEFAAAEDLLRRGRTAAQPLGRRRAVRGAAAGNGDPLPRDLFGRGRGQRAAHIAGADEACFKLFHSVPSSADLSVAADDIFIGAQLVEPHGAAGVELLRGDAHLAAEAELTPVGKAGGDVDVRCRAVRTVDEALGARGVLGDDGVAVVRRVREHVRDGGVQTVDHADGEDIVQILRVKVLVGSALAVDDLRRCRIQPQLDRCEALRRAVIDQRLFEHGQKPGRDRPVHKADLLGVADRGAAGFGVFDDAHGLVEVSILVHVDVADTGAGLDAGHGGIAHAGADEPRPAARDEQIYKALGLHDLRSALVAGILHDVDDVRIAARGRDALLECGHDGFGRAESLLAAAEHADVAALDGERRRVGRDVRAALINDGDQAERHLLFIDLHAVGVVDLREDAPRVIRQRHGRADAVGHSVDAIFVQIEPVEHDIRDMAACSVHVLGIAAQDDIALRLQAVRHGGQDAVFVLGGSVADAGPRGLRPPENVHSRHSSPSSGMWYQKSGAGAPAGHNVIEHLGLFAVGNDHFAAGRRCDLRGVQLRDHAAGGERGALVSGKRENVRVDDRHRLDEPRIRVSVRVAVIQSVDVREQDQQIRTDGGSHDGRETVVLADGVVHADLVRRHGVVFIDDRQRPQLQQPRERVAHVAAALLTADVLAGQQQLRHNMIVLREELIVKIHQLALADGGRGLLARHIRRTAGQIELADAHADRAGRDENDLVTCIFQVAEHFAQPLHALNVQPPGRMRECGSADFNNDSHNDPSHCMMASIIAHRAQNCIPFCLCCAKDAPKIPRARPDSSATCSRSIWRSAVRS